MDSTQTWNKIIESLTNNPEDIHTVPSNARQPLWFYAFIEDGQLYVENSANKEPSTRMTNRRRITPADFAVVYAYYHRCANGEINLRNEVAGLSRNTAYIFGLISKYEK